MKVTEAGEVKYPAPVTLRVIFTLHSYGETQVISFAAHKMTRNNQRLLFFHYEKAENKTCIATSITRDGICMLFLRRKTLSIIKMLSDLNSEPMKMPY